MYISGTKRGFNTIVRDLQYGRVWMVEGQLVLDRLSKRKKTMIWVSFSRCGIRNVVLFLPKETFNCVLFIQKVLGISTKSWGGHVLWNDPETLSSISTMRVYSIRASQDFGRLGIARFPHPPPSPDLARCDFWLFSKLKRKLEGSTFGDQIEVSRTVKTIFSTIPRGVFISVFGEWKSRLHECIDRAGEYL
jgi:hypothetical protein